MCQRGDGPHLGRVQAIGGTKVDIIRRRNIPSELPIEALLAIAADCMLIITGRLPRMMNGVSDCREQTKDAETCSAPQRWLRKDPVM